MKIVCLCQAGSTSLFQSLIIFILINVCPAYVSEILAFEVYVLTERNVCSALLYTVVIF